MKEILIHNTHGKDDIERASLAFVVASAARSANQQATVLLTIDGVWIAARGYADNLQAHGFAPLADLVRQFADSGGQIWVCGACARPRNITAKDLIEGAEIVGPTTAVEALANGANDMNF